MFALLGQLFAFLSTTILLVTVTALPWFLGGVVADARLLLVCGACGAAVCSLAVQLIRCRVAAGFPAIVLPLLGLALLGTWQLRTTASDPYREMRHAVAGPADDFGLLCAPTVSVSPGDTRSSVAMLLAFGLVAIAGCEQLRGARTVVVASGSLIINAIILSVIGFGQLFGRHLFELNERWLLDLKRNATAFGAFVNPNNAAGWLLLATSLAVGVAASFLTRRTDHRQLRLDNSPTGRLAQRVIGFMANLTAWQTCSYVALAFLFASVAATKSRGGIVAMLTAGVVSVLLRNSMKRSLMLILMVVLTSVSAYGLLVSLGLGDGVVAEIETLSDLRTASRIRLDHWLDTVWVAVDFPVAGTGLGSYRYATLPYQRRYTGVWHHHADNQYFEMLIESGVIGFLLFVLAGISCLLSGLAGCRLSRMERSRAAEPKNGLRVSRRLLFACGTTAVFAFISQAGCAAVDFGISMPAAGTLFVLIASVTAGICSDHESRPRLLQSGYVRVGRKSSAIIQICMIIAVANYIPDQLAAAQIDRDVVMSHRLLSEPFEIEKMDQLSLIRDGLLSSLRDRPDDPNGLGALARIASACFRWQSLVSDMGSRIRNDPSAESIYQATTFPSLIRALDVVETENGSDARTKFQDNLVQQLNEQQLERTIAAIQYRSPLSPRLSLIVAGISLLKGDSSEFRNQANLIRFAQPADARQLFELGSMAIRSNNAVLGLSLWSDSLELSEKYRPAVFAEGQAFWNNGFLLKHFGPKTYAASVRVAMQLATGELCDTIWREAEVRWMNIEQPVGVDLSVTRAHHLQSQRRNNEALGWLKAASAAYSNSVELRMMYAQQLERSGKFRDALREWHHVRFLDAENAIATEAVERIWKMK